MIGRNGPDRAGAGPSIVPADPLTTTADPTAVRGAGDAALARMQASPFARFQNLSGREAVNALEQLDHSRQLELLVTAATDEDRQWINWILHRFNGDLLPLASHIYDALETIFHATPDEELETLQLCLGARFGISNVGDAGTINQVGFASSTFTALDVRRMWRTLAALPPHHVDNLTSLDQLIPADGSAAGAAGGYIGRNTIGQILTPEFLARATPEERQQILTFMAEHDNEIWIGDHFEEGDDTDGNHAVDPDFDHTVRHEVGHAVDELLRASSTYCTTPAGGAWKQHHLNEDAVLDEMIAALHLAADCTPEQLARVRPMLKHRMSPEAMQADRNATFIAQPGTTPATIDDGRAGLSAAALAKMDQLQTVIANALSSDAQNGADMESPLAGRNYIRKGYGWLSYGAEARARKVSDYQFSAPFEWFAEAYAAYFDPTKPRGQNLVEVGDHATKEYFDHTVRPFAERTRRHTSTTST